MTPFGEDDTCAVNLFGLWYWFYPLAMGAKCVLIPNRMLVDHEALVHYLADKRVTRWDCVTPTLLKAVLLFLPACDEEGLLESSFEGGEGPTFESQESTALERSFRLLRKNLRVVVVSGESVKLDLLQLTFAKLPNTKLYNLLSTTEAGDV